MKKVLLAVIVMSGVWSVYAGFITVSINKSAIKSAVIRWLQSHNNNKAVQFLEYILRRAWKIAKRIRSGSEAGNFFIPPVMAGTQRREFQDAFRILFCGDLILLEDQVKRGNGSYDDMFEFTREYIQSADLAIGVFEGPMAGSEAGYSTSNYGDGKTLALNYPDTFGEAVKRAGFDLVTTANNHLLDKGRDGALRTLDVLDRIGLPHTGSYRSQDDKDTHSVRLIEKSGLKFAVLSYTYGSNGCTEDDLLRSKDLSFLTSLIVSPSSKNFEAVKESVRRDFDRAKELEPDFIVVLPHMGEQFLTKPDDYQRAWGEIFREFGADIILADHTHSVQPAEISTVNGRRVFTAWCPGNYANIYREYNGDASILVEVYIDRNKREVIGGSIIPMWTCAHMNGNYRPVPLSVIADGELSPRLTTYDLARAEEVCRVISSTVFGHAFNFDMVRERWHFDERGYVREKVSPLAADVRESRFMRLVNSAGSVCFVGDSVTQGSRNGGYPYYEPLEGQITAEIHNVSFGGGTVKTLIEHADEIASTGAGLYVVAVGTNDVRYYNPSTCAMTPGEYVSRL